MALVKMIRSALAASMESRGLVGIYADEDQSESFALGWVLDFNEEFFLLSTLDKVGRSDGLQLGRCSSLFKLALGGPYIARVEQLMIEHLPTVQYSGLKADMLSLFTWAKTANQMLSIKDFQANNTSGYVRSVDAEAVQIECFGLFSQYEGDEIFPFEQITVVRVGNSVERELELHIRS